MYNKQNIWTIQIKKPTPQGNIKSSFYSFESEEQAYEQVAFYCVSAAEWFLENLKNAEMEVCQKGQYPLEYYDFKIKGINFRLKEDMQVEYISKAAYMDSLYFKILKIPFDQFDREYYSYNMDQLKWYDAREGFLNYCLEKFEQLKKESIGLLGKQEITYLDIDRISMFHYYRRYFSSWVYKPNVFCSDTNLNESVPPFEELMTAT
jgi:hypothetical protein